MVYAMRRKIATTRAARGWVSIQGWSSSANAVSTIWWDVSTPQWARMASIQCWEVSRQRGKLEMR